MRAFVAGAWVVLAFAGATSATAGTKTWSGGSTTAWNTAGNWAETVVPGTGDDLVFTSGNPPNQPSGNDITGLSVRSLTFLNGTFAGPLTLGGNALVLDSSYGATVTLTNGNTTVGRNVTVSNPLNLVGSQKWSLGTSVNAVTTIGGDLSGSGDISDLLTNNSNSSTPPTLRLGGSNSGYTGTLTPNGGSSGLLLLSPAAMTGGLIDLNASNRNLWLTANAEGNPYVFGTGNTAGSPNVNFRNAGTAGLYVTGGPVYWDPGNGGDYTWAAGSQSQIRLNGSNATYGNMLFFGNGSGNLVLPADRALSDGGGGNNSALVTMRFALADDSGGNRLFSSSARLMILTRPAVNDATPGKIALTGGSTAVTNMNQVFDGNLSLNGGVLILDNVSWNDFVADRTGGYSAISTNTWQIPSSGGGFAARGTAVTIDGTGTTTATFNRSFTLGSSARGTNGLLYADAPVILSQGIAMTQTDQVTVRGGNTENNAGAWTVAGPVHEISGQIVNGSGSQILELKGNGTTAGGTIRISNTANSFSGGLRLNIPGGAGGLIAIFPDDACLGLSPTVTVGSGSQGQAALLLFENQGAGVKDFNRSFETAMGADGSSGDSGFGSWAGNVRHNGTNTVTGSRTTLSLHVQSGRFEFGPSGRIVNNSTGGSQTYNKGGMGTLVLTNSNVYGGTAVNLKWALYEGTLETWAPGVLVNGTSTLDLRNILSMPAGNLQGSYPTNRTWAVRGVDHAYSGLPGTFYGDKFTLDVATGLTLTFDLGANKLISNESSSGGGDIVPGLTSGTIKSGAGTWIYRSTATDGFGYQSKAIQVKQGIFDVTGSMGRGGLWLDGGTILVGTNSPFALGWRLRVDPTGGKIGISATAQHGVTRSVAFAAPDNVWNLGGSGTVTLASRNNLNLAWSASTFPDINAGETVRIERDGTGTGVVQLNDTAWTIAGRIGGTGGLQLGTGGTGTLTVSGGLAPALASDAQPPLQVDGSVVLDSADIDATLAEGYAPGVSQWVILEADSVSGTLGTVTSGYVAQVTATQVILKKSGGTLVLVR